MKLARHSARTPSRTTFVTVGRRSLNPDAFPLEMAGAAARTPAQVVRIQCQTLAGCVDAARKLHRRIEYGFHLSVEIEGAPGEVIAHVSPNARVWAGAARDWTRNTPELET